MNTPMEKLNETVACKRWHVLLMLALSGFAISTCLARLATAAGL